MSQSITPELRRWILDQVAAGHTPEAVLQAMATAGWQEDVALAALESTLTQHLADQGASTGLETSAASSVSNRSTTAEQPAQAASMPEDNGARRLDPGLGSVATVEGEDEAQKPAKDFVEADASAAGVPQTAAQRWAQRLTRPAADTGAGAVAAGTGTGTGSGPRPAAGAATVAAASARPTTGPASRSNKPQPKPMPDPDLSGSPRMLDLGDRQVGVVVAMAKPRVVLFSHFLSDEECDALVALAAPRMARSLTVENQTGGEAVNADRTSNGMFFRRAETELVARIETRIARLLRWPLENGEGLQVLNYQVGAEYKPHYDYFDPSQPGTPSILKRGGQRVGTLVMYLNNPERGGGTTFPDVGLEVLPQRGHAVFFSYDNPHPSTQTLHGGAPVVAGEKWVATKWLREGEFI